MRPEWLADVIREDDEFRAEREYEEQGAARRLMYKTTEAPRPEPTPELPGLFDDPEQDRFFADVMARVISKLRCEFKGEVIDLPKDFWRRDLPRSHDAA